MTGQQVRLCGHTKAAPRSSRLHGGQFSEEHGGVDRSAIAWIVAEHKMAYIPQRSSMSLSTLRKGVVSGQREARRGVIGEGQAPPS